MKGMVVDLKVFIGDEPMARVCKQPVKCPGRCCRTSLEDKDQVKQLVKDFSSGLQSTVNTQVPGKLKTWCLHFYFLPWILWPLVVYGEYSHS